MRLACVVVVLVALANAAHADSPWEARSTAEQRAEAHQLFTQGNDHFFKRDYQRALALYERAHAVFDHPRIRLATAEVLVFLGRLTDAHPHIVAALRWDQAPFDADEYTRAKAIRQAIERQVGTVVIRCATDGMQLTLDGQDVACPETRRIVMPGRHQVVGRKSGLLTHTEDVVVEAGREASVTLTLKTPESAAVYQRKWATWKPWAVVVGGGVVVGFGIPMQLLARAEMDKFRDAVARCGTEGCPAGHEAFAFERRAQLENRVAVGAWVIGGTAIIAGAVLVYVNRERRVMSNERQAVLAPVVTHDTVGAAIAGAW